MLRRITRTHNKIQIFTEIFKPVGKIILLLSFRNTKFIPWSKVKKRAMDNVEEK